MNCFVGNMTMGKPILRLLSRIAVILLSLSFFGCGLFNKPATIDAIYDPEITIVRSWMVQAGDGEHSYYQRLQPVIYSNKIYVTDAKSNLTVIDANSGQGLWQVRMNAGLPSSPSVGAGRVYVGTDQAKVLALDAETGEKIWQVDVSNQVLAQPTYANGIVIVKTINGELIGLDADNGTEKWRFIEEQPRLILRAHSAAKVNDSLVVAGFADGKIVAVTADKGQLIWERTIASPTGFSDLSRMIDIEADPVIYDGVVYAVSYQGNLAAIDMTAVQELWQQPISSYSGMAVTADRMFISDEHGYVWALDRRTGKTIWRQNELENRRLTAPQTMLGYLVVGDEEGFLHWMDQADGHFVSRQFFSRSGIIAQPVQYDDHIIVLSRDGMLVSLASK